jgi:hypothetical protein
MKHQYFDDINDYRKYGLLRLLATVGGFKLGITWMLTPADGRPDGGKTDYLGQPGRWRVHDPDLFDHLAGTLQGGGERRVGTLEGSNLIPGARYHSDILEDGVAARAAYMKTMLNRFQGLDIVFFDSDNGLEVKSCPLGRKGSSKFPACSEAATTFAMGTSLPVFQHYCRIERSAFARNQVQRRADSTGAKDIITVSTAHVLFLLVLHPGHVLAALRAIEALDKGWPGQFQMKTLNNERPTADDTKLGWPRSVNESGADRAWQRT